MSIVLKVEREATSRFRVRNAGDEVAHGLSVHVDGRASFGLPPGVTLAPSHATDTFTVHESPQNGELGILLVSCDEWGRARDLPVPPR